VSNGVNVEETRPDWVKRSPQGLVDIATVIEVRLHAFSLATSQLRRGRKRETHTASEQPHARTEQ
jgi:LmbE family N-acetylglucosaminyl deacetylase